MEISSPADGIVRWKVRRCGILINPKRTVCVIEPSASGDGGPVSVAGPSYGSVRVKLVDEGAQVSTGTILYIFEECKHAVVMKDLCAECGANLRKEDGLPGERVRHSSANVAMVHNIPELHVSEQKAHELAREDELGLLKSRKLVLLVDLDQTLIHTTITPPCEEYRKDVHCIRLNQHPTEPCMFTRIRPGTQEFLQKISRLFELHICTFGNRMYAHTIARLLDPQSRFFARRILSRNEAFDPLTKTANMKALFPRGERMVCIIDDRDEVWRFAANMVHVKPYIYFKTAGDINDPKLQLQRQLQQQAAASDENEEIPPTSSTTSSPDENNDNVDQDENRLIKPKKEGHDDPVAMTELDVAEEKEKAYLKRLYDILEEVHRRFYEETENLNLSINELIQQRDRQLGRHPSGISRAPLPTTSSSSSSSLANTMKELPNVADIMNSMRWRVLNDCRLVLSGLVVRTANIRYSRSYAIARMLGAEVQDEIQIAKGKETNVEKCTTHVIGCLHTHKVKEAQHFINQQKKRRASAAAAATVTSDDVASDVAVTGNEGEGDVVKTIKEEKKECELHLVNPHWLWDCYYYWRHEEETNYALPEGTHFDPQHFEDWVIHIKNNTPSGFIRYLGPQLELLPTWPKTDKKTTDQNKGSETEQAEQREEEFSTSSEEEDDDDFATNPLLHMAPLDRRNMIREVEEALASSSDNDDDDDNDGSSSDEELRAQLLNNKNNRKSPRNSSGSPFRDPDDSESSGEEDELNPELPKGWRSKKKVRRWSQAGSSEEDDQRDWSACPEGYDYGDAEEAHKVLLLRDSSSSEEEKEAEVGRKSQKNNENFHGPSRKRRRYNEDEEDDSNSDDEQDDDDDFDELDATL